jgi:hypothetical protein
MSDQRKIPSKFTEVSVPGVELRGGGDNRADETPFRITRLERQGLADRLEIYFCKLGDTKVNSGRLISDEDPLSVAAKDRRADRDTLHSPFIAHDDLEARSLGSGYLAECRECFDPQHLGARGRQRQGIIQPRRHPDVVRAP